MAAFRRKKARCQGHVLAQRRGKGKQISASQKQNSGEAPGKGREKSPREGIGAFSTRNSLDNNREKGKGGGLEIQKLLLVLARFNSHLGGEKRRRKTVGRKR